MKWTRPAPGRYTSGPYTVERVLGNAWRMAGPEIGPEVIWHTKVLAQDECERAARRRVNETTKHSVTPVVGDWTYLAGHYGQISAVLTSTAGPEAVERPLYCIKLPRGRRKCLLRHEFPVVLR